MSPEEIAQHQDAIRHLHGLESSYVETVPVTEAFEGRPVWAGEVLTFDVAGHPKATRVYAWAFTNDRGKTEFVAVLGLGPVVDATTAVKAYLVATFKKAQS